ncbi:hypothetical protein RJT34_17920 [Clitoria ternatea]|uniref:Uncharacterized protein n=1 Tax=Clitoria ternatea TaxID=43366 RepID=A0AAN9J9U9_CLITE
MVARWWLPIEEKDGGKVNDGGCMGCPIWTETEIGHLHLNFYEQNERRNSTNIHITASPYIMAELFNPSSLLSCSSGCKLSGILQIRKLHDVQMLLIHPPLSVASSMRDGCVAHTTILPIAKASAVVVQTTWLCLD